MEISELLHLFSKELPTKDTPKAERLSKRDLAEEHLLNHLADIFKSDPIAQRKASFYQGLYWFKVIGCYQVSLLIRYDKGSVGMFSSYTEIG